jgi:hypothetical protein
VRTGKRLRVRPVKPHGGFATVWSAHRCIVPSRDASGIRKITHTDVNSERIWLFLCRRFDGIDKKPLSFRIEHSLPHPDKGNIFV